jgi:hypothetical protein
VIFSKRGNSTVVAAVSSLRFPIRDTKVPWLVMAVVVDPVNGLSRRASKAKGADVIAVGGEGFAPGRENLDAPATVVFEAGISRVVAAFQRGFPGMVFSTDFPVFACAVSD